MHPISLQRWTLCWVVSLVLVFPPATLVGIGKAHAASKTKAEPVQIARGIHQWTGYLAKQAAGAKALEKNNKRAIPFWNAVKRLNAGSKKLERELGAKRPTYLDALGDTRSALTSVKVTYEQNGAKVAGIEKALTNIDRGVTLLERHAGPSKASKSGNKGLSAKQKRQLDAMKAKQKELKGKLRQVESKVSKNKAAIRAIRDIRSHSDRIYHSRNTAADFFAALLAARIIDGMLWGWHWWWGPWGGWVGPWCGGFVDIYYESVHLIDVDSGIIDAEIAIEDYVLEAEVDQVELDALDDELARTDFELSDAEIEVIAEPGFDQDIGDISAETLPASEPLPEPELPPEIEDLSAREPLPEPEPLPEIEMLPELERRPEPMPEPEMIPEPMPIEEPPAIDMPADDFGGFDGGGFDGGGMDFNGGGMDFDAGGADIDF